MNNWRRNIAVFLSGQGISLFGSQLVHYAVMWHITRTSQSGVAMLLFTLANAVPTFLISPFGGVWADRYPKKMLINVADAGIAVVTLSMAAIWSMGLEYIGVLLVCTAVRGLGQGIQLPAVNSFLPEITPEEHLTRANGFNASIQSMANFTAPILAGALLSFAPITVILYIDVVTAAISVFLLMFFVKSRPTARSSERPRYFTEIKEGVRYMLSKPLLRYLLLLAALFNILITPVFVLTPLQTVRNFDDKTWRLAAVQLAFFLGVAAGGITIGAWGGFKSKLKTMALSAGLFSLAAIGLGLIRDFGRYLACMAAGGLVISLFQSPIMSLLQTQTDEDCRGRVMSVFSVIGNLAFPLGMSIWGPLGDIVSIDRLLIASGLGIVVMGISIIRYSLIYPQREQSASPA
jgi:DHA3 family macrolide efflux protein-like MFS transporter